ncbi:DEAD/DEAH box helicase [Kiritimatiellaeota bacterium B1221]|nr:DEAD/DEAH box helicase [Kiritimatiellaeota bacterium B1221]
MTFIPLGLRKELLSSITEMGFTQPTAIQSEVIPFMLKEKGDLVALSQTGTGKTAAFGLPLLQRVKSRNKFPQALVLCPTRELCKQIAKDINNFASALPELQTLALYGGADIRPQLDGIDRGAQIIVATPGRLVDLLRTRKLQLFSVERLVLDEADEMLNLGFEEDLNFILDEVPAEAQRLLFSATMPLRVRRMMETYMDAPHEISVGERNTLSELVEHQFMLVHAKDHYAGLRRFLDVTPEMYGIIFCRTKADTQLISDRLNHDGYVTAALHGDLLHEEREAVMQQFQTRQLQGVVATDVAARGLHIDDLTHVIHYRIPDEQNTYTHRSGRTGRAGKQGVSLVILHARERFKLDRIEKVLGKTFQQIPIPTGIEIARAQLHSYLPSFQTGNLKLDELAEKLARVSSSENVDAGTLRKLQKLVAFYQVTPELNTEPEKVKPRPKTAGRISGREAREMHVPRDMTEGMIELVMNLGKRNELDEAGLRGLIDVCGSSIELGRVNIVEMQSYFEVPYPRSHEVINHFKQNPAEWGGRSVSVAFAGNAKVVTGKGTKKRR